MNTVQRGLMAASGRVWVVLLIIGLNVLNFAVLFGLEARFEAAAGLPTFDTQNDLTRADMLEQLPRYTGAALEAYVLFAAYDFVFPAVAAVMLAVLLTVFLRLNGWALPQRLLAWRLPQVTLLAAVWDWLENVGMLGALWTGGAGFWVEWALVFKRLKLLWLGLSGGVVAVALGLLLAYALWLGVRRWRAGAG